VTLKTGIGVHQGHWKYYHLIDRIFYPIDVRDRAIVTVVTMALSHVISVLFSVE